MRWSTPVTIPRSKWSISHDDRLLLLGSCFTDEIGALLTQHGFNALSNPTGTLYNPLSIAQALNDHLPFTNYRFIFHDGLWHSMQHHGSFSHADKAVVEQRCQEAAAQLTEGLTKASVIIITFGTSWVYEQEGRVVANCHKLPEAAFTRRLLSVEEIVATWLPIIQAYPDKHWLFTVSPIRHLRDGLHANQISKGLLLQAIDRLVELTDATYFPSYEILIDELRDYRFYAEDLCHPSAQAIEYIWERLADTFFSDATRAIALQSFKAYRFSQHRPLH